MRGNASKAVGPTAAVVGRVAKKVLTKMVARGRPRKDVISVDTAWFEKQMKGLSLSQRGLAAKLTRDVSIINRTLNGSREATAGEVASMSGLLGVPPDEVLRRLGYSVRPPGVTITGALRADGRVTTITAQSGRWQEFPPVATADRALIAETHGGPLAAYHGAVFCYLESPARTVPPDAIGRLCVVEAADEVVPVLGVLSKADRRGQLRFTPFSGGDDRELSNVIRAHVISRIIFP